ncbi:MAG: nickel-responsive transcriptional regulator NikR [Thermoplasmatota archaeon]
MGLRYKLCDNKNLKIVARLCTNRVTMNQITRFGVSIEPDLLSKFDQLIENEGYENRSEAIRDLIRNSLITTKKHDPESIAMGTLTMIYDHHTGNLTNKLLKIQHDHTNEILTTTHIHLDHDNCLEVLILKGKTKHIQRLADNIKSLKGIKHGKLVITTSSY